MVKKYLAIISFLFLISCSTQSFHMKSEDEASSTGMESSSTFFIGGLGQKDEIDAASICASSDKVAKVEAELGPLNWLIGTITLGIYSPRDYKVHCTK